VVAGIIEDVITQQRESNDADAQRITESFNDYFAAFDIRIAPDDVVDGNHRTIRDASGWAITYRVDRTTAGSVCLEFYATHRQTNDRHVLISADGSGENLDAIKEMLIVDSDNAGQEFQDRNEATAHQLRQRDLYPHR